MTTTPADNPCNCRACGAIILANVTDLCEDCEADINAYYDERPEHICGRDCDYDPDRGCPEEAEGPEPDADADNQAFADACGSMSREDWDADNDWLASAGWGEM